LSILLSGTVDAQERRIPLELMEATIPEIQEALEAGTVTSADLVRAYLARIEAYDQKGPRLNAMIMVNPKAMERAEALDAERREKGPRGPLHGIPIVVKDNYDTADMPTTGASLALSGLVPPDDSFQVRKLREAGAIIIGKTNMHELAAGITTISSLGGQTRNPYDPRRNPGGSSGGTGAAVAANFAVAGMGSDTCGSIRIPSSHNSLVGLRGTAGLSSRDGIIPLSHTQDIGGPLTHSVTDLAILLDATVGPDPNDPITARSEGHIPESYLELLDPQGLEAVRVGILLEAFGDTRADEEVTEVVMAAAEEMKEAGAGLVDIKEIHLEDMLEGASVIGHEFKFDLMDYLGALPEPPVRSLGDIIGRGLHHEALERTFKRRNAPESRDAEEYFEALDKQNTFRNEILELFREMNVDVLLYPTIRRKPALIGEPQSGSNCLLSAASGFPAISLPAGFTQDGLPVGVELLGEPFSEPELIKIAYAFEQATRHRRPPASTPALVNGKVPKVSFQAVASGDEIVPATESFAGARAEMTLDPSTYELIYTINITELDEDQVLHTCIHRGAKGENGPVVYILTNGPEDGSLRLEERDRNDMMDGKLYLTIYTNKYPRGAIRGQILPK
jgi:Asp-tRNA(Asn)/Glu-tRNA(Gln) amidotransferase A subunit family amidase